jgi:RNA polymerase sigma-70 factor (ECF subfamily)
MERGGLGCIQYANLTMPEDRSFEFENTALPHTVGLLRYALRLAGDKPQAEDLVQETLLLAWRNFRQFQRGTNCKAWLFRILKNLHYKQTSRHTRSTEVPFGEEGPRFAVPEQVSANQQVREAFDRLTPEHQEVLQLAVVEGFGIREVAEVLQVPQGTVMSRLSRARASLRDALRPATFVRGEGL